MGSPPPILQANISMADSLLLMVIALVVFGPRRLPLIGRQIGKLMYEFRKASNDFKFQMEEELRNSEEADRRKREEAERQQRLALAAQSPPAENSPGQNSAVATGAEAQPSEAAASAPAADPNSPTPEARPEEGYPRIAPPSTGEIVAAARPSSAAASGTSAGSAIDDSAGSAPASALERIPPVTESSPDESRDESRDVTEQATHHG
jgi:sec-independent protein translocase protein TatB